jgi:hypothetical protein
VSSKFKGVFEAAKSRRGQAAEPEKAQDSPTSASPKRGRPSGKRSDPDFVPLTVYVRKETHRGVKRALLDQDEPGEISELVEELLADWLAGRQAEKPKR